MSNKRTLCDYKRLMNKFDENGESVLSEYINEYRKCDQTDSSELTDCFLSFKSCCKKRCYLKLMFGPGFTKQAVASFTNWIHLGLAVVAFSMVLEHSISSISLLFPECVIQCTPHSLWLFSTEFMYLTIDRYQIFRCHGFGILGSFAQYQLSCILPAWPLNTQCITLEWSTYSENTFVTGALFDFLPRVSAITQTNCETVFTESLCDGVTYSCHSRLFEYPGQRSVTVTPWKVIF